MNKLFKIVVWSLIFFAGTQSLFANDSSAVSIESSKYTKFSAGLMVGGGVLAAFGGANAFESGGGAAFYSGIALFGAGTGMLIWGLSKRSDANALRDSLEAAQSRSFVVGVAPLKGGGAAGAVLRW